MRKISLLARTGRYLKKRQVLDQIIYEFVRNVRLNLHRDGRLCITIQGLNFLHRNESWKVPVTAKIGFISFAEISFVSCFPVNKCRSCISALITKFICAGIIIIKCKEI